MALLKRLKAGIKKRRTKRQTKRGIRKLAKAAKGGAKISRTTAKKVSTKGRIRKGAKAVKVTGGGAYASYGKKSKAAGSFRSKFSAAKKKGQKTFTWDGRRYSTKTKK